MIHVNPSLHAAPSSSDDEAQGALPDDDIDSPETEMADELSEETGIDLSEAGELDADNVPSDEEFDRVLNAPD
jgi:hypothetical protein